MNSRTLSILRYFGIPWLSKALVTTRYCSLSNILNDCNDPQFCRVVLFSHPLGSPFLYIISISASIICNSETVQSRSESKTKEPGGFFRRAGRLVLSVSSRSLRLLGCLTGGICYRVELPNPVGILTRPRASDPRFRFSTSSAFLISLNGDS